MLSLQKMFSSFAMCAEWKRRKWSTTGADY